MLTEFPGLLLWTVPGLLVWLAGEVLIVRAVASGRGRSQRGLRVHLVGLALFMLGLTIGGLSTGAAHGNLLVGVVIASVFGSITVLFAYQAVNTPAS